MAQPPDPSRPRGEETRDAVAAVLRDQAHREEREARTRARSGPPRRDANGLMLLVALVLTAVSVSVWTNPPGWARPAPLPEPSPQRVEAGLRMDMWVAVQRIRAFQAERQRLPVTLWEAIPQPTDTVGLRYELLTPESFRLVGTRGDFEATYRSDDPAHELAERARAVIGVGGDQ